jgi:uncharacterized protein
MPRLNAGACITEGTLNMKLSRFNLWVEDYPAKGEHLLFNSRTQALIKIDWELKEEIENIIDLEPSAFSLQLKKNFDALMENGIIVKDEKEENDKLKDFFRQLKHESRAVSFEATILTTYSCNFKCVYCFEESVKDNIFLDDDTSVFIIKWLRERAGKRNLKRMHLVFYGGEPLLNTRPIYNISRHMKPWAEKNNIGFDFSIITNGSLVTPDLTDKLLSVGLKSIRVSIDGDRECHDKKRPFLDGSPTFDIIINNIKSVIGKVDVGISGNFDGGNVKSIRGFLDYLDREGLLYRLNSINFSPIVPRLGPKKNPGAIELSECLSFLDKDGLFDEALGIKKELMNRGIDVRTGLAVNACPLIMEDAGVTIDPRGKIYKCNSLVGYPEFSIGDVREEEFNGNFHKFMNSDAWKKCPGDCPYVPMCQGGCRFFSYMENGNFNDLSCKRDYFDRVIPELIKLEYEKSCK